MAELLSRLNRDVLKINMKRIATLISLMLLGLVVLLFSRQKGKYDNADLSDEDEWYGDLIGQETLRHL